MAHRFIGCVVSRRTPDAFPVESLGALRSRCSLWSGCPSGAGLALGTLRSCRASLTRRSLCSLQPLRPGGTLRPLGTCGSGSTLLSDERPVKTFNWRQVVVGLFGNP